MSKINTIHLLWSIREIPSDQLSLPDKGILSIILSATQANGRCIYSLEALSKVCGISSRRLQPRLKKIAEQGFILIKKPSHTTHGSYYMYDLNIHNIMKYCPIISPDETSTDYNKSPDETSEVTGRNVRKSPDETSDVYKIKDITDKYNRKSVPSFDGAHSQTGLLFFNSFWEAYPRKENKKQSQDVWRRKRLDEKANLLIADIINRQERHAQWKEGYIPYADKYLNDERWNDEIKEELYVERKKSVWEQQADLSRETNEYLARSAGLCKGFEDFDDDQVLLPKDIC